MMKSKNKKSLRTFTAITCAILLGISGVSAYAEDSVQNLEEKTSELQGEIKDLKSQLDATCAEMEEIAGKIASTKQAIADTQAQLEIAQFEEQSQYSDMKLRIKQIYESGDYGFIEYLCSANSMNDLLNKADYIETMSQYDRKKMSDLINVRVEIENTKTTLEDENGVLDDLQKSLTEKQSTLNQKIASASSELNDYSQQLARAKAAIKKPLRQKRNARKFYANRHCSNSKIKIIPIPPALAAVLLPLAQVIAQAELILEVFVSATIVRAANVADLMAEQLPAV